MNFKEFVNYITENYGIFGTHLIGTELSAFDNLPSIPDGYTLYEVNSDEDVERVRSSMRIENFKIDKLYPNSENEIHLELDDYERKCFLTMLRFENVFNYWCGRNTKIKYNESNKSQLVAYDYFSMKLWDWVKDEISTEELKKSALQFEKVVKK